MPSQRVDAWQPHSAMPESYVCRLPPKNAPIVRLRYRMSQLDLMVDESSPRAGEGESDPDQRLIRNAVLQCNRGRADNWRVRFLKRTGQTLRQASMVLPTCTTDVERDGQSHAPAGCC